MASKTDKGSSERISRREFLRRGAAVSLVGGAALGGVNSLAAAAEPPKDQLPEYRVLGRTGLKVSVLSQGGALTYAVDPLSGNVTAKRQEVMLEAAARGINLFDSYKDKHVGDYACLAKLGKKALVIYKSEAQSAAELRAEVDATLKAMKRERLDVIMPHGHPWAKDQNPYSEVTDAKKWDGVIESMEEMARLKKKGKVGHVGYVSHFVPHFKRIILEHEDLVDVIMVRYGPFERFDVFEEIIDMSRERKMGVIVFKTIDGAWKRYDERVQDWREQGKTRARMEAMLRKGFTPAQTCIRYALKKEGVHSVLVGMRSKKELAENLLAV